MPGRNRARSTEELKYPINQAQSDFFDLPAATQYDQELMANTPTIVDPLNDGPNRLPQAVQSGEYQPGEGDYQDFPHLLKDTDQRAIPNRSALKLILDSHTEGYQESE